MRSVDFSPLYRSTVGFDRLFSLLDSRGQFESGQSYPPYNIERTGVDSYRITMAVAGFDDGEISIEAHRNVLTVSAQKSEEKADDTSEFLYRGIAARSFTRRFQLADHMEIGSAFLRNGLLYIELQRNVPEEMKPRRIPITSGSTDEPKTIEASQSTH